MKSRPKTVSVVMPVLNEEEIVPELLRRTRSIADSSKNYCFQLIFVDDGSTDRTAELLSAAAAEDSRVKLIRFSRNFGHQEAITAGMDFASGDAVIILDGDLQDPPEMIPELLANWEAGFQIVYGIRAKRKESFPKRLSYFAFYRILKALSEYDIPLDSGDFSLMDKSVIDAMKACPERDRFLRGIRAWVGFKQIGVPYRRDSRFAGKSKYSFSKLVKLAYDGIISNSALPLRLAGYLGLFVVVTSILMILATLYLRLFTTLTIPGQSSIMISVFFIGGVQLAVLGILGEYIYRIYKNVKGRPLYIVASSVNLEKKEEIALRADLSGVC